jgi:hypothetical protein
MSCAETRSQLIPYWLGELGEADEHSVEEHVFACDPCSADSERIADLIATLGRRVPATLTEGAIARLEREGVRMRHTRIRPGERVAVPFAPDDDLLVHRLQLDVSGFEQLDAELFDAVGGALLVAIPGLMFEPDQGEVNLVCQRHYAERLPPDAAIRLIAVEPGGRRVVAEYGVLHRVAPGG